MLEWHIKEVESNTGKEGAADAYRIITAANTAWSICDWVFRFITERGIKGWEGVETVAKFRDIVKHESPELALCRLFADAYKHSRIDHRPVPTVETIKLDWVEEDGGNLAYWAIIDQNMQFRRPDEVLKAARIYWLDFMTKIGAHQRSSLGRSLVSRSSIAEVLAAQIPDDVTDNQRGV